MEDRRVTGRPRSPDPAGTLLTGGPPNNHGCHFVPRFRISRHLIVQSDRSRGPAEAMGGAKKAIQEDLTRGRDVRASRDPTPGGAEATGR